MTTEYDAATKCKGTTPLMGTSMHRGAALLNLPLDAGANVNATNVPYMTTDFLAHVFVPIIITVFF